MTRIEYHIVVVDRWPKPFPGAKALTKAGVPVGVAVQWAKVRRQMSPAGLKRKLKDCRN